MRCLIARGVAAVVFAAALLFSSARVLADEPVEMPLWAGMDQNLAKSEKIEERGDKVRPNRFISGVVFPTLTLYPAAKEIATGTAIIICPGGGYGGVAIDKEGHEVARWLNSIGITAVILKYRMPHVEETGDGKPLPLIDVQRAIRTVRALSEEWNVNKDRVGVMGFSAGGHLAAMSATLFERGADRPDFVILGYPVISMKEGVAHVGSKKRLLGDKPDESKAMQYSLETRVSATMPPVFAVHAKDDKVKAENSILFCDAMKAAGAQCELVLFEKGGHGFGLGVGAGEVDTWPAKCEKWMRERGVLGK